MEYGCRLVYNIFMELFAKSQWVSFTKSHPVPSKRWAHSSTRVNGHIYIFGGTIDQEVGIADDTFYMLDVEKKEFELIRSETTPKLRDSHIAFTYGKMFYIWGGIINQKVTNECFGFDGLKWKKVAQYGLIPAARQSSIATVVKGCLLIYGGCDEGTVYDDFNLFEIKTRTWYRVPTPNIITKRENSTFTIVGEDVYMFGGQAEVNKKDKFYNDLFKLTVKINLPEIELKVKLIKPKNLNIIPERSSHCTVCYQNSYLIVLGGMNYPISKNDLMHLLCDVWGYDIGNNQWHEIKPKSSYIFKKHANFTAEMIDTSIIIFGGLRSTNGNCYDELLELQLFDMEDYSIKTTCDKCDMPYLQPPYISHSTKEPKEQPQHQLNPKNRQHKMNYRTLYKTAQLITHPYHAIGLLIKGSLIIQATQILIKLQYIQNRIILSILDNGRIVDQKQFESIAFDARVPHVEQTHQLQEKHLENMSNYSNAVRYGCFKLSQAYLFVHANQNGNASAVITADGAYYYSAYFDQAQHQLDPNHYDKLNDYAKVNQIFKYIGQAQDQKSFTSKKILFNLNCDGKKSNYEMVGETQDIQLKRLVDLGNGSQSLREYLNDLFLEPPKNLKITINYQKVTFKPKQKLCSVIYNDIEISLIKNCAPFFRVYYKGFMVGKLSSYSYRKGGIVVLPDGFAGFEVICLRMTDQQLEFLYEIVEQAMKEQAFREALNQ